MNRSWRSSSERRCSASCSAIRRASTRRRACQTMARNMAAISGHLEQLAPELDALEGVEEIDTAVAPITQASTTNVGRTGQTRKP